MPSVFDFPTSGSAEFRAPRSGGQSTTRTLQIETSEITIPLFRGPLPSTVVTDVLKSIAMVDALKPAEDSARPSLQSPGGSAEAALLTAALRELGAWECRHGLVIDPVAAGHIRQALEAIERQLSAITGQATEEQHLPSERRRLN